MEYRAIYKCRLCGERYVSGATGNKELAFRTMVELTTLGYSIEPQAPTMTEPHLCKGGGFGMADFQGWEAINEPGGICLDKEESGLTEDN